MQFAPREMHSDAAMEKGIPLGRAGTPDEAAGAVYLLCLPEADYITGEVIVAGGGLENMMQEARDGRLTTAVPAPRHEGRCPHDKGR